MAFARKGDVKPASIVAFCKCSACKVEIPFTLEKEAYCLKCIKKLIGKIK